MTDDSLKDRKRALEEAFFAKYNAKLLADLKQRDAHRARKEALSEASGIQDEELINRLVELNIESETLAALSLIPLVEVAWADGSMDDRERKAVLQAAEEQGIHPGTPSFELLQRWLDRIPDRAILGAWKEYISDLAESMSSEDRERLREHLLQRARKVASAAGGFLGFDKISEREESVLADLESAF